MTTTFSVPCPQCKAALLISHDEATTEPQPQDRLICPVHGDVGSYAEFKPDIEKVVTERAQRMIEEMFRKV
jgi:hypothetical protein